MHQFTYEQLLPECYTVLTNNGNSVRVVSPALSGGFADIDVNQPPLRALQFQSLTFPLYLLQDFATIQANMGLTDIEFRIGEPKLRWDNGKLVFYIQATDALSQSNVIQTIKAVNLAGMDTALDIILMMVFSSREEIRARFPLNAQGQEKYTRILTFLELFNHRLDDGFITLKYMFAEMIAMYPHDTYMQLGQHFIVYRNNCCVARVGNHFYGFNEEFDSFSLRQAMHVFCDQSNIIEAKAASHAPSIVPLLRQAYQQIATNMCSGWPGSIVDPILQFHHNKMFGRELYVADASVKGYAIMDRNDPSFLFEISPCSGLDKLDTALMTQ